MSSLDKMFYTNAALKMVEGSGVQFLKKLDEAGLATDGDREIIRIASLRGDPNKIEPEDLAELKKQNPDQCIVEDPTTSANQLKQDIATRMLEVREQQQQRAQAYFSELTKDNLSMLKTMLKASDKWCESNVFHKEICGAGNVLNSLLYFGYINRDNLAKLAEAAGIETSETVIDNIKQSLYNFIVQPWDDFPLRNTDLKKLSFAFPNERKLEKALFLEFETAKDKALLKFLGDEPFSNPRAMAKKIGKNLEDLAVAKWKRMIIEKSGQFPEKYKKATTYNAFVKVVGLDPETATIEEITKKVDEIIQVLRPQTQ